MVIVASVGYQLVVILSKLLPFKCNNTNSHRTINNNSIKNLGIIE